VVALLISASPVAAGIDRASFLADLGLGYDLTNQLYFEQTFDSTAFTGRTSVSDPQGRLQALGSAQLQLSYGGASRIRIEDRVSAGELLLSNVFLIDWRHQISPTWRSVFRTELGYRQDRSFEFEQTDIRETALLGLERRTPDLSTVWRAEYRFNLATNDTKSGLTFYPDYYFHRLTLGFDRFNWIGPEWGLSYTLGFRSFPDTTLRNYANHVVEARFRMRSSNGAEIEFRGNLDRRSAEQEMAIGDRFTAAEGDLFLRYPVVPGKWTLGAYGGFFGTAYDDPDPAYFNNVIPRAEASIRYERFPDWTVTSRLQAQVLRVPEGGGLGDPFQDGDAFNAAHEEYDQLGLRMDVERMGATTWFFFSPSFGRRNYRFSSQAEGDLLARSSYWFGQLSAFAETRLGPFLRARISADLFRERHDIVSDDLTSIYMASELRYLFAR
jgi:hypothetical protein